MPNLPKCSVCETEFLPLRYGQKTCSASQCKRKAATARAKAWRAKKKLANAKMISP